MHFEAESIFKIRDLLNIRKSVESPDAPAAYKGIRCTQYQGKPWGLRAHVYIGS